MAVIVTPSLVYGRVTLADPEQMVLAGTKRAVVFDVTGAARRDSATLNEVEWPSAALMLTAVSTWSIYNRLALSVDARAVMRGNAQLLVYDFGPRSRLVLAGRGF